MKNTIFGILLMLLPFIGSTQSKSISGQIIDSKTKEPLSFATIIIPNTGSGTVTNIDGRFKLKLRSDQQEIKVSYIGYEDLLVSIPSKEKDLILELKSAAVTLTEIIVRSKTPWEYIQGAKNNYASNVAQNAFNTRGFFKEKTRLENDKSGEHTLTQAVFKSCFNNYADTSAQDQNQLALLKQDTTGSFRSILYDNKKLKKFSDSDEEEDINIDINGMTGGGPQDMLTASQSILTLPFFKEKYAKKFEYSFGDNTVFQGKNLIVIDFVSKRKIEFEKFNGTIYLDYSNLAIVALDYQAVVKIPFYINMLISGIAGIKIEDIEYKVNIHNQLFKDRWYPKELIKDIKLRLNQKGEIETLQTEQIFNIDQINLVDPKGIDPENRFNQTKDYDVQVKPIEGWNWEVVNVVE